MKKTIACVLIAAMLCLALCGCANRNSGYDNSVVGTPLIPEVSPAVSPMVTPDLDNGTVEDEDGMIEEKETDRNQKSDSDKTTTKPAVSPSPKVTSEP